MKIRKLLSIAVCIAMLCAMMTGCGSTSSNTSNSSNSSSDSDVLKIGVMQFGEFTALQNAYNGFVDGLAEAGFVDGENIVINYSSAAADTANCPTIADKLINDGSDLIFAIATPSVSCLKEKTTTIPVLYTAVTDPVASGIVDTYDASGCNISGTSDMNPVAEQIALLTEILPDAKSVAVMYCSSESNSAAQFELAKAALDAAGIECVQKTVSAIDEVKSAIESLKGKVDALYIPTDNTLADGMTLVSATATDCGIPTIVAEPGMVVNGGFATFGIDYYELGKQTAQMAVEVLTSDDPLAAVAAMPVGYQTAECETAVNSATADALGITLPESVASRANFY